LSLASKKPRRASLLASVVDESDVLVTVGGISWEISDGTDNPDVWTEIERLTIAALRGEIDQRVRWRGDVVVSAKMRVGPPGQVRTWRYNAMVGPLGRRRSTHVCYEPY
jgi:hypothetical protein